MDSFLFSILESPVSILNFLDFAPCSYGNCLQFRILFHRISNPSWTLFSFSIWTIRYDLPSFGIHQTILFEIQVFKLWDLSHWKCSFMFPSLTFNLPYWILWILFLSSQVLCDLDLEFVQLLWISKGLRVIRVLGIPTSPISYKIWKDHCCP